MTVHVLIHRGDSTGGESDSIRAIYADPADAARAVTTRTAKGYRSTALGAHDRYCCDVEEWEVLTDGEDSL